MRLRVLFFLTFFATSLWAQNTAIDSSTIADYERRLVESEQSLRDIRTNADILDDLFKPITDQAAEVERQLERAEKYRRAEFVLILLLVLTVLILAYLGVAFIRLKTRGRELDLLQDQVHSELEQIVPASVVDRVIHEGEIEPSIWQSCLVIFLKFGSVQPFNSSAHRMEIMGQVFECVDRQFSLFGLQKIKTSGPIILGVYKITRVTPQQQLQRTMECISSIQRELKGIEKGRVEVRIGMDYGDVISGLIGQEKLRFDIWGSAVSRAARALKQAEPQRVYVGPELAKIAPSARIQTRPMNTSENVDESAQIFELV